MIRFSFALLLCSILCCKEEGTQGTDDVPVVNSGENYKMVMEMLSGKPNGMVLIMAHRGDWKNVPENSLAGIRNCIAMGIDIVEIDIKMTKDNKLILMHDETLDRTTSGSGRVENFTWEELKNIKLRNADGSISDQTIPSLEMAMEVAKEKVFVFIDKSYNYLDKVYSVLLQTGTLSQSVVEGVASLPKLSTDYPAVWENLNFVPRIGAGQTESYINGYLKNSNNRFLFPSCNLALENNAVFETVQHSDKWLLFAPLSNTACSEDFSSTWQWSIDIGIDILITDKPRELVEFLRKKGKHQ